MTPDGVVVDPNTSIENRPCFLVFFLHQSATNTESPQEKERIQNPERERERERESMQGSKESYSPQVHDYLYPHAQPGLYPPPPPPANQHRGYQQYQGYFGGAEHPSHPWSEQPAASDGGPFHYQDDADCITFLRGCLAGLCCCWLLEQCCCL
ncbi:uncharacterized protein LOC112900065 [Panicum hallii]|uniref:uncharacterized protein LOC112900065 n=1 Tax=Panicum hallii TaxID=206008 RepID=UPI000DF4CAD1|nr:uncharacterized protein LOC112900065 [Panicum hallii]